MYYIKPEPWLSRSCVGFDRCPASFFSKSNGLWRNILVTKNNFLKNINTFFCESPPNITCFEVFLNTSFLMNISKLYIKIHTNNSFSFNIYEEINQRYLICFLRSATLFSNALLNAIMNNRFKR